MAQSKIYWDTENYHMVEKIFRKSVEFCNENDTWKLNVAHVLFMQESKYKEAISFYEPLVKKHYDNVYPSQIRSWMSLPSSLLIFASAIL
jgi:tetratricopeptide repeat protein 30